MFLNYIGHSKFSNLNLTSMMFYKHIRSGIKTKQAWRTIIIIKSLQVLLTNSNVMNNGTFKIELVLKSKVSHVC